MRRTTLLAIVMMSAVLLASGVALAQNITCPNRDGGRCVGTDEADEMTGTNRPDTIKGRGGDDQISARRGDDRVSGGEGGDLMDGGPGRDKLNGGPNPESVVDFMAGGTGNDLLVESPGDDRYGFESGWGRDEISGDGDPPPEFQPNFDALCFACGANVVSEPLTIDLSAGSATDGTNSVTWEAPAIERATGGSGADGITGNTRDNVVNGYLGPDSLNVAGDPTSSSDFVDCGGNVGGDGAIDTVLKDPGDGLSSSCTAGDVVTTVP